MPAISTLSTHIPKAIIGAGPAIARESSHPFATKSTSVRRASSATPAAKIRTKIPMRADSQPKEQGPAGFSGAIKKHPVAMIACLGLIVAGVVGGTIWYLNARHYESTDDAFIDGRPVLISPQVTGNIVQVNVTDNQPVKAGDLLAKIDPRDYQAAVDQAAAQMRQAEATMKNLDAQVGVQRSQIEQATKQEVEAQAALNFSQDENKRYQDLVNTGAGTVQRAQQASSGLAEQAAPGGARRAHQLPKISAENRSTCWKPRRRWRRRNSIRARRRKIRPMPISDAPNCVRRWMGASPS